MTQRSDEQIYRSLTQLRYIALGVVGLLVVFMGVMVYFERATEEFESTARYRPPGESLEDQGTAAGELKPRPIHPVRGQQVYVPAYSHIYHQNGSPVLLTITLSVRNTSDEHTIVVESVRYFDTTGREVRSWLKRALELRPLATTEFLVEKDDTSGGSGASFLVEWVSENAVSDPVIEAVMIDTDRQQGISFAREGRVIRETRGAVPARADSAPVSGNRKRGASTEDQR